MPLRTRDLVQSFDLYIGVVKSFDRAIRTMHRVFQKFIDLLSRAGDADAFEESLAFTATALDLSCFAYLALPDRDGKNPLIFSTYPANWVSHYVSNHYERLDPVIARALENPEPFRWDSESSSATISPAQREFLNEASEFGIRLGFTVPIRPPD